MDRQAKIEQIRRLTNTEINHFQYSKIAKIPFKVHSFLEIMNLRMLDFCESTELLIRKNHIIPALSTIRVIYENLAITFRISIAINNSVRSKVLPDNFDELITKISFGTKYNDEIVSHNIMTHIDKLEKTYPGIKEYYDALCEFVHPNWDGVEGSYSELFETERKTKIFKVITSTHPVFEWIDSCFDLCLNIYLDTNESIKLNLPEFSLICEKDIIRKNNF